MKINLVTIVMLFCTFTIQAGWDSVSTGTRCLRSFQNCLYSVGDWGYVGKSCDQGKTWEYLTTSPICNATNTDIEVSSLGYFLTQRSNSNCIRGVYYRSLLATTWTERSNGLSSYDVCAVTRVGSQVYVGTADRGAYRSDDTGVLWKSISTGLLTVGNKISSVFHLASNETTVFAAGDFHNIYRTIDQGEHWVKIDSQIKTPRKLGPYSMVCDIFAANNLLFAAFSSSHGDPGGVYCSSDDGSTWINFNKGISDTATVWTLAVGGDYLFGGVSYGVICRSLHPDSSWRRIDLGLPRSPYIPNSLSVCGNDVFASMSYNGAIGGLYRRPLNEVVSVNRSVPRGASMRPRIRVSRTISQFIISMQGISNTNIKIDLFTLNGHHISQPIRFENSFAFGNLPAGTYLCLVCNGGIRMKYPFTIGR